ncbi:MAG: hypothetical protein WBL85_07470 [Sedimentisphaerales bacterium]
MIRYNYSYPSGEASLFVSAQDNGYFIGSLFYYKKSGSWAEQGGIIMNFDLQQFRGESTDEVIKQAEGWFKNNLSKNFTKQA